MHLQIRFLIGLSKPGDDLGFAARFPPVADARASSALAILATHYPALSAVRGTGYWKGESEPNLVVESIVDTESEYWVDCDAVGFAQSVAGEVARALDQESVALVVATVRFSLKGPHAIEGPGTLDADRDLPESKLTDAGALDIIRDAVGENRYGCARPEEGVSP